MACVELPRDAYGRAIPLDTGTLYKKNGAAVFIYHYDYDPRDKAWYVETDEGSRGDGDPMDANGARNLWNRGPVQIRAEVA